MSESLKTCTKKTFRHRYYSSMNYQQYYLLFGPPTPIVKPLEDPTQDIPELCLDSHSNSQQQYLPYLEGLLETPAKNKDRNSNQAQSIIHQQHNPSQNNFLNATNHTFTTAKQMQSTPKQKLVRERPRSKSDNSEYLIFSFLQKIHKKGKKKTKLQ